jgi:hypothetical protein
MCMTLEAEDVRRFWMAAHVTSLHMTNAYHQPCNRTGHMSFSHLHSIVSFSIEHKHTSLKFPTNFARVKIAFITTFTYFHCFLSSGIPFLSEFLHTKHAQVPHSYKLLVRVFLGQVCFSLPFCPHPHPSHGPYKLCLCMSSGWPGNFTFPFLKAKTKPLVMTPRVKHAFSLWGNLNHKINYTTHNCWWFVKGLKHSLWEIGYMCRVQL